MRLFLFYFRRSTSIWRSRRQRTSTSLCRRRPYRRPCSPASTTSRPSRATSTWLRHPRTNTCNRPRSPRNRRPRRCQPTRSSTRSSTSRTRSSKNSNSCSSSSSSNRNSRTTNSRPCSTSTSRCRRTSSCNRPRPSTVNNCPSSPRLSARTITPTTSNSTDHHDLSHDLHVPSPVPLVTTPLLALPIRRPSSRLKKFRLPPPRFILTLE